MTRDLRAAPLPEYENEDVFAWIRRQGNPKKKTLSELQLARAVSPISTTNEEKNNV